MAYKALYRVWRPQKFSDVFGQEHVVHTLQNACRENRIAHAYLLSGPRGTGKTTVAKLLAKVVNCATWPTDEPCNECEACVGITNGNIVDVIEIDAASNRGIEEIRNIREQVKYAPTQVRKKVYIIDEVHMLTTEAFNALLKTLEEPPPHVLFILATTEPHKLPMTIISRCQRFDFHRIRQEEMVKRMRQICKEEEIKITPAALSFVAKVAAGGMRDALSLLDQASSIHQKEVDLDQILEITGAIPSLTISEMAEAALRGDAKLLLERIDQLMNEGKDAEQLLKDTLQYYRDMMIYNMAPELEEIKERVEQDPKFPEVARQYQTTSLHRIIEGLNSILYSMKWTQHPQILLEMAYLKIVDQESGINVSEDTTSAIAELTSRLEALEKRIDQMTQQVVNPKERTLSVVREAKKQATKVHQHTAGGDLRSISLIQHFLQRYQPEQTEEMIQQWDRVLLAIKERRVQAHAWLMNSEIVALTDQEILLAFKNEIHRVTTETKHKDLIEETINEVLGIPYQIRTVMKEEWDRAKENHVPSSTDEAIHTKEAKQEASSSPLLQQIIKMVGNDVIQTKP